MRIKQRPVRSECFYSLMQPLASAVQVRADLMETHDSCPFLSIPYNTLEILKRITKDIPKSSAINNS